MTPDARKSITAECRPVARRPVAVRRDARSEHGRPRGGFSLIELMIAIIILGLGLVMVATMFPVAWGRARDLSEFTTKQTITPGAVNLVENLLRAAPVDTLHASAGPSFAGDLIVLRESQHVFPLFRQSVQTPYWIREPWVHELNMQNIRVKNPAFVDENPWQLEDYVDPQPVLTDNNYPPDQINLLLDTSYTAAQVTVHQRLFPPVRRRINVDPQTHVFSTSDPDNNWDDTVATRRFTWAVFHRFREAIDQAQVWNGTINNWDRAKLEARAPETRLVDLYFVTLRRPQSTNRYARQAIGSNNDLVPNPYDLTKPPVTPAAMSSDEDVMFPVAWRVQISVPKEDIQPAIDPNPNSPTFGESLATNIPTEVTVPPDGFTGSEKAKRMLVTMFPRGTKFIDEITGRVYTVTKVRESIDGLSAALTLDQEILQDDINLRQDDPRCDGLCPNDVTIATAVQPPDDIELLRTVWVFPPPVQERDSIEDTYPSFAGNTPVVGIDIRTLDFSPSQ